MSPGVAYTRVKYLRVWDIQGPLKREEADVPRLWRRRRQEMNLLPSAYGHLTAGIKCMQEADAGRLPDFALVKEIELPSRWWEGGPTAKPTG